MPQDGQMQSLNYKKWDHLANAGYFTGLPCVILIIQPDYYH